MFEGLVSPENVNFLLVFAEGILSFFSPCVIPLLPVYISYLAGNAKVTQPDGTVSYRRGKVFLHTLFFVLGISFAFFLLGLSFTFLGGFFSQWQKVFSTVGGLLILLFGLYQVGFLRFSFLERERKFHLKWNLKKMNPLLAFVMGFTFSFAWTPCVGPMLSSVLLMASSARTALIGNLLVLVYSLGFVIPFLLLGLFTSQMLNFLKKHQKALKYTIKAGGVILIIMGIMVMTGWMNGVTGFLSSLGGANGPSVSLPSGTSSGMDSSRPESGNSASSQPESAGGTSSGAASGDSSEGTSSEDFFPAPALILTDRDGNEHALTDQYGNEHSLSDYKGKTVFLNFWMTWCGPCKREMPDIEKLYHELGENEGDVIILGVAGPGYGDVSREEIIDFLDENGYTYPVVFDEDGTVFASYGIQAFPTTYMIGKDGGLYGRVVTMLTLDQMKSIIEQTQQAYAE